MISTWLEFTYVKLQLVIKRAVNIWDRNFRKKYVNIQKLPPEMFYRNMSSKNLHKIHRKTPVSEPLFNKAAGLEL